MSYCACWRWNLRRVPIYLYPDALQKSDRSLVVDNSSFSTTQWKYDDLKVHSLCDSRMLMHKLVFSFGSSFYLTSALRFSVMDMAAEGNSSRTGLWSLPQEEMGEWKEGVFLMCSEPVSSVYLWWNYITCMIPWQTCCNFFELHRDDLHALI